MSDDTARWALPLLYAGQAQKEVTHNEALTRTDLLLQPVAVALGLNLPPATPAPGDCWIVGEAPTDAWAGHARALAGWTEGGWRFLSPREGMFVWLRQSNEWARYADGAWSSGTVHGRVIVGGNQVIGPRAAAIANPSGGTVVDGEARAAIAALLAALRTHGVIASA